MLKERAIELIEKIKEIPGRKVITMTVEESDSIFEADGKKIGDNIENFAMFAAKLARGMGVGGAMTVVQFMGNGRKVIFGFVLGENNWVSIPADEMEKIHNVNHETGEPLPVEPDVDFCDFY